MTQKNFFGVVLCPTNPIAGTGWPGPVTPPWNETLLYTFFFCSFLLKQWKKTPYFKWFASSWPLLYLWLLCSLVLHECMWCICFCLNLVYAICRNLNGILEFTDAHKKLLFSRLIYCFKFYGMAVPQMHPYLIIANNIFLTSQQAFYIRGKSQFILIIYWSKLLCVDVWSQKYQIFLPNYRIFLKCQRT